MITDDETKRQLDRIERIVRDLARDKNLARKQEEWISEKEAAGILNFAPRTLRKYVKCGKVPVFYRSRNNRNYMYQRESVMKFKINPTYLN